MEYYRRYIENRSRYLELKQKEIRGGSKSDLIRLIYVPNNESERDKIIRNRTVQPINGYIRLRLMRHPPPLSVKVDRDHLRFHDLIGVLKNQLPDYDSIFIYRTDSDLIWSSELQRIIEKNKYDILVERSIRI